MHFILFLGHDWFHNIRCTVSEILAQIDHKGPNWTFLTFEMTFGVIPCISYYF